MSLTKVSEEDFLDQDPEIRGQAYACISFVSPEDVIIRKVVFTFGKFLGAVGKDIDAMLTALDDKFAGKDDGAVRDMVAGIRERHAYLMSPESLQDEVRSFESANSESIDRDFAKSSADGFRTSVRGFKVRGVYETVQEATARAKKIKSFDDKFNVYVAQVGCWCPWSPNPDEIGDSEYGETQLNSLMKSYKANEAMKNQFYESRKQAFMDNAAKNTEAKKQFELIDESQVPPEFRISKETLETLEAPDTWTALKIGASSLDVPHDGLEIRTGA